MYSALSAIGKNDMKGCTLTNGNDGDGAALSLRGRHKWGEEGEECLL